MESTNKNEQPKLEQETVFGEALQREYDSPSFEKIPKLGNPMERPNLNSKSSLTDFLSSKKKSSLNESVESAKEALEQALSSLTPAERAFALQSGLQYMSIEQINILKQKYKEKHAFTLGLRIKAAFSLIFQNKITKRLRSAIMQELDEKLLLTEVSNPRFNPIIINKYEETPTTSLVDHLKEAGIELSETQLERIKKYVFPDSPSSTLEQELNKSISEWGQPVEPSIVETITIRAKASKKVPAKNSTVKKAAPKKAPTKKASKPKKT